MKNSVVLLLIFLLSGCTTILDHSTSTQIEPDPTKRTIGTWVDDQQLETIIAHNINKASDQLRDSHTNIDSFNNVILLTGQVPNTESRELAGETARKVNSVRQVHNELSIQNNTTLLIRTSDSYLASKVKVKLLADNTIESSRINVICEDAVIYLMGLIGRAEGERAAQIASKVDGVRRVVKIFEYID